MYLWTPLKIISFRSIFWYKRPLKGYKDNKKAMQDHNLSHKETLGDKRPWKATKTAINSVAFFVLVSRFSDQFAAIFISEHFFIHFVMFWNVFCSLCTIFGTFGTFFELYSTPKTKTTKLLLGPLRRARNKKNPFQSRIKLISI